MQKIKSLFIRDKENPKLVTRNVEPECQWVLEGEGQATIKWDGSACLILDEKLYRRHNLKEGRQMPTGWLHWSMNPEQKSGHGWIPVTDTPADDYHRAAYHLTAIYLEAGTYELVGPKVCGNPHSVSHHQLVRHGSAHIDLSKWGLDFDGLSGFLEHATIEGIVWHHEDGRMTKIKRKDFGFAWPIR